MSKVNTFFSVEGITDSDRIIHTPSSAVKENLLYVQEVGKLKSLKSHKSERENLASYLFICVLEGQGTVKVREKQYDMRQGDCIFINCREHYEHQSSETEPWKLAWVHYNGASAMFYYSLFLENNHGGNKFTPVDVRKFEEMIDKLMKLQAEKELLAELESNKALVELQNEMIACVVQQKRDNEKHDVNLNEIREYLNEHYHDEDVAAYLTKLTGKGEEELNQIFKKAYGIDLYDYVLNRRFNVAKEMLRFTIKPVREIIEESGIRNNDLFRRLFADSEGMTAEEYRMKWAQWVK